MKRNRMARAVGVGALGLAALGCVSTSGGGASRAGMLEAQIRQIQRAHPGAAVGIAPRRYRPNLPPPNTRGGREINGIPFYFMWVDATGGGEPAARP